MDPGYINSLQILHHNRALLSISPEACRRLAAAVVTSSSTLGEVSTQLACGIMSAVVTHIAFAGLMSFSNVRQQPYHRGRVSHLD